MPPSPRRVDRLFYPVACLVLAAALGGCPKPTAPPQPNPTPPKAEPAKEARRSDSSRAGVSSKVMRSPRSILS